MVNWDVVAKVNSHSVPDYTDVLPDPFPSTSRLPELLDLLQNQHAGLKAPCPSALLQRG